MKSILGISAVTASMLLIGCSAIDNDNSLDSKDVKTGKAYYLDSAVSGINYQCGNQIGITDKNGGFIFENGEGCTFSLGGIKLRDLDKSLLKSGVKIVEDDIHIATLLQSLDMDGDASNGIEISQEEVEIIRNTLMSELVDKNGSISLPKTLDEISVLVTAVENNLTEFKGYPVDIDRAKEHLAMTTNMVVFSEKIFYSVEIGDSDCKIKNFTFNQNMTSMVEEDVNGNKIQHNIQIDGAKIYIDDGEYFIVDSVGKKYIDVKFYLDGENQVDEVVRFYYDELDAKKYIDTLDSSNLNVLKAYDDNITLNTIDRVVIDTLSNDKFNKANDIQMYLGYGTYMYTTDICIDNDSGNTPYEPFVDLGCDVGVFGLEYNDYYTDFYTIKGHYIRFEEPMSEGTWKVENNHISFTPKDRWPGGEVHNTYWIVDNNTSSYAEVTLNFPIVIKANNDEVNLTKIDSVANVSVLANDTYISESNVEISIEDKETLDGIWSIVNNKIIFEPAETFTGGEIKKEYKIVENGRVSKGYIYLNYPLYMRANDDRYEYSPDCYNSDYKVPEAIEYNVLLNDDISNDASVEVYLIDRDGLYVKKTEDWEVTDSGIVKLHIEPEPESVWYCGGFPSDLNYETIDYVLQDGKKATKATLSVSIEYYY